MNKIGFVMLPTEVVDDHLKELTGAELKILLAITRKTIGWHKETDWICNQQMMEITGLTKKSVTIAIKKLIERGLITQERTGKTGKEKLCYEITFGGGKKVSPGGVKSIPGGDIKYPHKRYSSKDDSQKITTEAKEISTPSLTGKDVFEKDVLAYYIHITGKTKTNKVPVDVGARFEEGTTLAEAKQVILYKYNEWWNNPKMRHSVNLTTLFRPSHFGEYLSQAEMEMGETIDTAYKEYLDKIMASGQRDKYIKFEDYKARYLAGEVVG